MAKLNYKNGITSVVLRTVVYDSSSTVGAGKTGLTHNTSGLIISTIADNEATATAYTVAANNIETITTLGTYAAPTASKCRFKEVDSTNHPGLYEIQIANARWAVSNARSVVITISGASGGVPVNMEIQLDPVPAFVGDITAMADIRTAVGLASANLDTQLSTIDDFLDTEIAAIKAKTDNLPTTPASTSDVPSAATVASTVWANVTRTLSAGTNIVLAKGTGVTGLNDLDAAGIRSAVGLASANLDTQLTTIDDFLDTEVAAIKTKTDFLPSATAGSAGGLFIAGTNAATTITTGLTTTFTGNLTGSVGSVTGAVVLDSAERNTLVDLVWDEAMSGHTTAGTYGGRIVRATNSNTEVQITGSNHIAADVHEFQTGVITAGDFAANAITASALATDAVTEIQSGLATQASVNIIDDFLDTEIAAIKAKTDNLPSDPADQSAVESAITSVVSLVAAQITTDHGSGSYIRNTEPTTPPTVVAIRQEMDSNSTKLTSLYNLAVDASGQSGDTDFSSSYYNEVADAVLSRNVSNVESGLTQHTLAGAILGQLEWALDSSGNLSVYKTDGVTELYTKVVNSTASDGNVITGLE
jgi:hypothetical protein